MTISRYQVALKGQGFRIIDTVEQHEVTGADLGNPHMGADEGTIVVYTRSRAQALADRLNREDEDGQLQMPLGSTPVDAGVKEDDWR